MRISAMLTRKRIFEFHREPVTAPAASRCLTELYCKPPSPTETVAQTFGKTYTANPGLKLSFARNVSDESLDTEPLVIVPSSFSESFLVIVSVWLPV